MHERWPSLPLDEWEPTYRTLHRWSQIVGKIRLGLCRPVNHWWHTTLRFGARGLTTTLMPVGEDLQMEMVFDFIDHRLVFQLTDGRRREVALEPKSVADFYAEVMKTLDELGVRVHVWPVPVEVMDPVPFPENTEDAAYDRAAVDKMWCILRSAHDVLSEFRGQFIGKSSPVHFFWGAFDLAVTRFSGRRNPNPPEDPVQRAAYSHEVISHGFWFGGDWPAGGRFDDPLFYAYALPQPEGFERAKVQPAEAFFSKELGEYVLPYSKLRAREDPEASLLAFLQSTYDAGRWATTYPELA